jgi:ribonuclease Z
MEWAGSARPGRGRPNGYKGRMSGRELVVLGTASQVPTRTRNHNGYLLRWDAEGVLFDPGEGTQRQFTHAGLSAAVITRICLTHAHGDHCLGLPGILQRLSVDQVSRSVDLHYPGAAQEYVDALRRCTAHETGTPVREAPVTADGATVADTPRWRLTAHALEHRVPAVGYRLEEPDGVRLLPERLAALGLAGPEVGRLAREGQLAKDGRTVTVQEVSAPRRGQVFAFVMDTAWCAGALAAARGADLLVCESTFLECDADLAARHKHLTAAQAAQVAVQAGVGRLVLTHFSQRYGEDLSPFLDEARAVFPDTVLARDLDRIPLPPRRG